MKKLKLTLYGLAIVSFFIAAAAYAEQANTTAANGNSAPIRLVILTRSNGSGVVTSSDGKISCGSGRTQCYADYHSGDQVALNAQAADNSTFKGWSDAYDNSNSDSPYLDSPHTFIIQLSNPNISGNEIIYAKFVLNSAPPAPTVDPADRQIPRVMFWWGKVNQHWDLATGAWQTDADGYSGARENKLSYCRKFFPTTTKVVQYKNEVANTWKDRGNLGNYVSVKMSYRCVLAGEDVSGTDVSNIEETTNQGSICYYFPYLPLCVPFSQGGREYPIVIQNPNQPIPTAISTISPITPVVTPASIATSSYQQLDIIQNQQIKEQVDALSTNVQTVAATNQSLDPNKEKQAQDLYRKNLQPNYPAISTSSRQIINNFVAYGADENTKKLGVSERVSVVDSYKKAYDKLPANSADMAQVLKIANGQAPSVASAPAEKRAQESFQKVYKRSADQTKISDAAALKVMAYGLKPQAGTRNLETERKALKTFTITYKRLPRSTEDWNIVAAIAYSGSSR